MFDIPEVQEWLSDCNVHNNTLWLSATTGFGKSVIAAYLSKALQSKFPAAIVTYFFCKDQEYLCKHHQIIRTIIEQICSRSRAALQKAQAIWESETCIDDLSADADEFFDKLFLPTLEVCGSTTREPLFIILDGLNELPISSRDPVLTFLKLLQTLTSFLQIPPVRVILTSQSFNHEAFRDVLFLPLKSEYITENVESFVTARLSDTLRSRFQDAEIDPIAFFRDGHQGMFQWASALLTDLEGVRHTDFQAILASPPKTIAEVYQQVLERFARDFSKLQRSWLKEILRWVLVGRRELTLLEIAAATLYSDGIYDQSPLKDISDLRTLLSKCGALLQIVHGGSPEQSTVIIVHDSFKQFLKSSDTTGPTGTATQFRIEAIESETKLAITSLEYLAKLRIEMQNFICLTPETILTARKTFPLFEYASLFWSTHLSESPRGDELLTALSEFFNQQRLRDWIINVMAFAQNSVENPLSSQITRSVPSSLTRAIRWLEKIDTAESPVGFLFSAQDQRVPIGNRFQLCCIRATAGAWATIDPYFWSASMCCFEAAEELMFDGITTQISDVATRVEKLTALVPSAYKQDRYRWFGNQAIVYMYHGSENPNALLLAENCLVHALGSPNIREDACTFQRLADCLSSRSTRTNSLGDANQAIEYAEKAVQTLNDDTPPYADFVAFQAHCLLTRASLSTDSQSVRKDWENAVDLCRTALRASVKACRAVTEYEILDTKNGQDTNSAQDTCYESGIDMLIFLILGLMTQALSFPEWRLTPEVVTWITARKATLCSEIKHMIRTSNTALLYSGETNPHMWISLGDGLLACYRESKKSDDERQQSLDSSVGTQLDNRDLNQAIFCYRKAVSTGKYYQSTLRNATSCLGHALLERKHGQDIDEAITCYQEALAIDKSRDRSMIRNLAYALTVRNNGPDDRAEAIKLYRKAVEIEFPQDWELQSCAAQLANLLELDQNLDEVIELRRLAFVVSQKKGFRGHTFKHLASALLERANAVDLDECIERYETMDVENSPPNTERDFDERAWYAEALRRREKSTNDLDKAISNFEAILDTSPETSTLRYSVHISLARALNAKGGGQNGQRAIAAYRDGIDAKKVNGDVPAGHFNELGEALLTWGRSQTDHEEAIECFRKAVQYCTDDKPDKPVYLSNLASELYGGPEENRLEIIHYFREAARLAGKDNVYFHVYAGNLGVVLVDWSLAECRSEAVTALTAAVQRAPLRHADLPAWLENLATALDYHDDDAELSRNGINWFPFYAIPEIIRDILTPVIAEMFYPCHELQATNKSIAYLRKSLMLESNDRRLEQLETLLLHRYSKTGNSGDLVEVASTVERRVRTMEIVNTAGLVVNILKYGLIALRMALDTGKLDMSITFAEMTVRNVTVMEQDDTFAKAVIVYLLLHMKNVVFRRRGTVDGAGYDGFVGRVLAKGRRVRRPTM